MRRLVALAVLTGLCACSDPAERPPPDAQIDVAIDGPGDPCLACSADQVCVSRYDGVCNADTRCVARVVDLSGERVLGRVRGGVLHARAVPVQDALAVRRRVAARVHLLRPVTGGGRGAARRRLSARAHRRGRTAP